MDVKCHKTTKAMAIVEDIDHYIETMDDRHQLSKDQLKKLRGLEVKLKHEPLPQHTIEARAGSHVPTRDEISQFQKLCPLKRGMFSPQEDEKIVRNWKSFCKLHNWDEKDVKPFLSFRSGTYIFIKQTRERMRFVQFLADGLPNRTLYSVLHRFRNLNNVNRLSERYDVEEDEAIINYIEKNPNLNEKNKFAQLAKYLNRSRASVWRRYERLKKKKRTKSNGR